jgi:hypothetical protein
LTVRNLRDYAVTLFTIAAIAVVASPADARFTVTPTTIDIERQRGRTASGTFEVKLAKEPNDFEVEVKDVVQQADGSTAFVEPTDSPFSASSWITVTPRRFPGEPRRTQPVEYTVRVPPKAEPGEHFTAITVTTVPRQTGATAATAQAIAVRMTVRVFGKRRPGGEIVSLDAPSVSGGNPVRASAVVRNTGNVALDFDGENTGSIEILDGEDARASLDFEGQLLPEQERTFELAWDDAPLFGQFRAVAELHVGKDVLSESKSMFQVPWRQIGAFLLVALAAMVLTLGRRSGRF